MIRLSGVHKTYRTGQTNLDVLKGVDLEIAAGEFVSIIGRSGSGKTTLLNIIGGLDSDYRGTVEVEGTQLGQMSDRDLSRYRNRHIGFVFQSFHLLGHMTCLENVILPALFDGGQGSLSTRDAQARGLELLAQMDLADKAKSRPIHLSGGQKQRIAIARALLHKPSLLICDEPTGNLDRESGDAILNLFSELNRRDGITLIIVTHDDLIAEAAARVVRIVEGNVVEDRRTQRENHADTQGSESLKNPQTTAYEPPPKTTVYEPPAATTEFARHPQPEATTEDLA